MAAVSAWSKPGAWAIESEEHEAASSAAATSALDKAYSSSDSHQSTTDFPSLSAAATTKIPKKKKKQTLSLAEFSASAAPAASAGKFQPSSRTLTLDEQLALPTGPRERSEEELQRSRGFGHFNGGGGPRGGSARGSDENPRRGPAREPRDLGPSRADEVDDWGSMKKSVGGFERRESERDRGFFDSQSRADESDSWISKKGAGALPPPGSDGRRERRSYDLFDREGSNGGGVDSESRGKKREENGGGGGGRLSATSTTRTPPHRHRPKPTAHPRQSGSGGSSRPYSASLVCFKPLIGGDLKISPSFVLHLRMGLGTPMRRDGVAAVYVRELFDDLGMRAGLEFERHWGIWYRNLSAKYELDFSGAVGGASAAMAVAILVAVVMVLVAKV